MTTATYLSDDELITRGLDALMQALGPVEATRFLTLSKSRRLESVEQHRRWQEALDVESFFDQVFGASVQNVDSSLLR